MAEPDAPEPQKPAETEPTPTPKKGLGAEAWAAISAILVAVVTGVVTLVTHFFPGAEEAKTTPAARAGEPTGVARLVGRWSGEAESAAGKFKISLEVTPACAEGRACGTVSVSHLPCHGDITLHRVRDGEYEFSVDNFRAGSAQGCTPGEGEFFVPTADGKLVYRTGYDPSVRATLKKQP